MFIARTTLGFLAGGECSLRLLGELFSPVVQGLGELFSPVVSEFAYGDEYYSCHDDTYACLRK